MSSISSPLRDSFNAFDPSSIAFFSASETLDPCSFRFFSVEWIRVSAWFLTSTDSLFFLSASLLANKEADKKKRESVDVRNQADTLIHSTEKNLKEHGSKVSDAEKKAIEDGSNALKESLKGEDIEDIKKKTEALVQACTNASVFFLMSSISSPLRDSFNAFDPSSIAFFSASETLDPCSFRFFSVEWIRVSAWFLTSTDSLFFLSASLLANKEADKKKRESVDVRNQADTLIHSTEKNLKEHGSKVSDAEKKAIEDGSNALKESLKGEDIEDIKKKTEALVQASMKLGEAIYKSQQSTKPDSSKDDGNDEKGKKDDNVVDADFEEVKDENKEKSA